MDEKRLLTQVITAVRAGQTTEAQRHLQKELARNPRDEKCWLYLSALVERDDQQIVCFQHVLEINPENQTARKKLDRLKARTAAAPSSPDVEQALQNLQPGQPFNAVRKTTAKRLGELNVSDLRIVNALIAAMKTDPSHYVREVAAESLKAPAHQEILQQHPYLMKAAISEVKSTAPGQPLRTETRARIRTKTCPQCKTEVPNTFMTCRDCGYEFMSQKSTIKRNERYHWKEAICTVACFIGGLSFVTNGASFSNAALVILGGLALMGLSVAAFIITEGWRYADDLPIEKRIIVYIPVGLGIIMTLAAIVIMYLVWRAAKEAFEENP